MRFSPAFLVVNIKVTTLNLENSLSQNKAFFRIEVDYRKRLCIKWLGDTLPLEYELVEDSGTEILITPHIGC
ncbi:hypothetical protein CA2015_3603 [Cyclobacterium amurskyense]|uniref:Uncharacterized protein n=1 Tax=Cyclobacterium amurskyense TaxID=320787 RepID=A0A0H4PX96_9BACT|nr:hypothetical protein CA2015_3603 [Cyclobacterium amurskyense]